MITLADEAHHSIVRTRRKEEADGAAERGECRDAALTSDARIAEKPKDDKKSGGGMGEEDLSSEESLRGEPLRRASTPRSRKPVFE
ncbi:MAG TPA: hypothetical protein VML55_22160 [Planctomycetaceae bacterium]|nr:hypothetical protein [Planctomycetaceae bacterium]